MNDLVVSTDPDFNIASANLYAVLGLHKTATKEQIRKAYQKASMKFHPDRNPGDEAAQKAFQAVKHAFDNLSDFVKREFYDATGGCLPNEETLMALASDIVKNVFTQAIEVSSQNANTDFEIQYYDPVADVRDGIQTAIDGIHKTRGQIQQAISRTENLNKRFKRKNSDFADSPVGAVIIKRLAMLKHNYHVGQVELMKHELALRLVDDYLCPPEQRVPPTTMTMSGITMTFRTLP